MANFTATWQCAVLRCPKDKLTQGEKNVLIALSTFADWHTHDKAFPGIRQLMNCADCSKSVVKRALAKGEEYGFIEQYFKGSNYARRASAYRLLPQGSAHDPLLNDRGPHGERQGSTHDPLQGSAGDPPPNHLSNQEASIERKAQGSAHDPLRSGGDEERTASGSVGVSAIGSSSPQGARSTGSSSQGENAVRPGSNQGTHADLPNCDACRMKGDICPYHVRHPR